MTRSHINIRAALALPMVMAAAGCTVVPPPAPAPPPVAARPAPPPAPVPAPSLGWEDRALTPGEWRYDRISDTASYGVAGAAQLASLTCEGGGIMLTVPGLAGTSAATLRTTSGQDVLTLVNGKMRFDANDPRLDRIVFSRGRFAIEDAQGRALTLPSWSEISRVVEDCRS